MTERKGWVIRRVVVELPLQGDYSERDLRWDVARALSGFSLRHSGRKVRHGTPAVKETGKVLAALMGVHRDRRAKAEDRVRAVVEALKQPDLPDRYDDWARQILEALERVDGKAER